MSMTRQQSIESVITKAESELERLTLGLRTRRRVMSPTR